MQQKHITIVKPYKELRKSETLKRDEITVCAVNSLTIRFVFQFSEFLMIMKERFISSDSCEEWLLVVADLLRE
jgi:hypothetical protein